MNLQGRCLGPDLCGDDVHLLHTELAWLGLPVPEDEWRRGFFGPGTFEAVKRFQTEHGLVVDGIVGDQTAPVINHAVEACKFFVVKGVVRQADGSPIAGAVVRAFDFDQDLHQEYLLGEMNDKATHCVSWDSSPAPIERTQEKPP